MRKCTNIIIISVIGCFGISLISCSNSSKRTAPLSFPKGFLWGVSQGSIQAEGDCPGNDYHAWEQMGKVPDIGLADNSYVLYDTDSAEAQSLHLNAFRITFEWARIEPRAPKTIGMPLTAGDVDMAVVNHYHDVVQSLIDHGLTPVVTLLHYALPLWDDNPEAVYDPTTQTFSDGSLGGWTNPLTAYAFSSYARFIAQQFSGTVKYWLTENEPMANVLSGYIIGDFPPAYAPLDLDLTAAILPFGTSVVDVIKNMIAGHALAYHAIHDEDPDAEVSFPKNSVFASAVPDNPSSQSAASRFDHFYNLLFLDAVTRGVFDDGLTGTTFTEVHPEWADTLDFIGLNYYISDYVVSVPGVLSPVDVLPCDPQINTALSGILSSFKCPVQGPSETQGFTDILLEYARRYHLPILVTENGTDGYFSDGGAAEKTKFIVQNIMAVHDAIDRGADILGYLYWTLNYDYEWTSGYRQNNALFYVDDFSSPTFTEPTVDTDFTRIPIHPAADVYSAIAAADGISPTIIDQYGH